jgi:hypothetical protein
VILVRRRAPTFAVLLLWAFLVGVLMLPAVTAWRGALAAVSADSLAVSDSDSLAIPPAPDWTPDSVAAHSDSSVVPVVHPDTTAARVDSFAVQESLAIATAKTATVGAIDSTESTASFDAWFAALVGPDARIFWEVNDCGEGTGSSADSAIQIPLCVETRSEGDFGTAFVWLVLGSTYRAVDVNPPQVFYWQVNEEYSEGRTRNLASFARAVHRARTAR